MQNAKSCGKSLQIMQRLTFFLGNALGVKHTVTQKLFVLPGRSRESNRSSDVWLVRQQESAWNLCELLKTRWDIFGNGIVYRGSMPTWLTEIPVGEERRGAATSVQSLVRQQEADLAARRSCSSRRHCPSLDTSSSLHTAPSSTHSVADKGEPEDKGDVNIRFRPLGSSWSMNDSFLRKPDWGRANPQHV